jgi:hypothetical protein
MLSILKSRHQQLPRQLLTRVVSSSRRQQATTTATTGISRTYRFRHTAVSGRGGTAGGRRRPTSSTTTTTRISRQNNNNSRRKKSTTAATPMEEEVFVAAAEPPTARQLWLVFWTAAVPMIGFGFTGMSCHTIFVGKIIWPFLTVCYSFFLLLFLM